MIPIKQKYLHIQDSQHGDCWRTCIASILECDVDIFPYHNGDIPWPDEYSEVVQILESMGYDYLSMPINKIKQGMLDCRDTDGYSIAIGKSNRGVNHSVVWKNGIAHDPHPDNSGISDIIRFEFLIKEINTDINQIVLDAKGGFSADD
jgi:hypothetical protein